jgi:hypothetical protein
MEPRAGARPARLGAVESLRVRGSGGLPAGLAVASANRVAVLPDPERLGDLQISELFDDVLGLCREAGLVSMGVITIDGTKPKANASMDQNRSYRGLIDEILREAEATDQRGDELYGEARGDELP